MKRKMIVAIIMALCVTACGNAGDGSGHLSAEKKELLSDMVLDDESEKEILAQYDYALSHLREKYPSYEFTIVDCEPADSDSSYTVFTFVEIQDLTIGYECYVYDDGDSYRTEDNFYGYLLKDDMAAYLSEFLMDAGIDVMEIECDITTVQGDAFDESMDLQTALNDDTLMEQRSNIYILDDGDYMTVCNTIRDLITEKNIYGSYRIIVNDEAGNIVYKDGFNTL